MDEKYATSLRPVRGTIYTLLALALALFGAVGLLTTKWSADTFAIAAWCGVCAAGLGWCAWANLAGDWDMAKTNKPAMGAVLMLIVCGRLLQVLAAMHLAFVERHDWIYWTVAVLALAGAMALYRRLSNTPQKPDSSTEAPRMHSRRSGTVGVAE